MSVEEQTLQFIEDYRSFQLLWDANHKDYTNKVKRSDALKVLAREFNLDVPGVKLKIKSLRSYFSKERQKVLQKGEDGHSVWFAYKSLLFIADPTIPRDSQDELPDNSSVPSREEHDFAQPIRTKKSIIKRRIHNESEDKTFKFRKQAADDVTCRDEWMTFGRFVTDKIRKLNPLHQLLAQRQITNCLLELQLKEFGVDATMEYPGALHYPVPSPSPGSGASSASPNVVYAVHASMPTISHDSGDGDANHDENGDEL